MPRGGARPGAGRKPKAAPSVGAAASAAPQQAFSTPADTELTPLQYFLAVMNDRSEPAKRRDWAAQMAAPYLHRRSAEEMPGKRAQAQQDAEDAARGQFSPRRPPRLVVSNG